jgi:hypothetical protein
MNNKIIVFTVLVLSILVLGCSTPRESPPDKHGSPVSAPAYTPGTYAPSSSISFSDDIKTESFKSKEELLNFMKQNSGSSGSYYGGGGMMVRTLSSSKMMATE